MKFNWRIVLAGVARLVLGVVLAVTVAGFAFMVLIKLLLGVHLHALE
ncbi:hypothetical protein [Dyella sp. C9]|nr:hypothetical protein [Dyella sp. C9]